MHLFLVDSANDRMGGSEFSSSSSSLKLTFGRLPFCFAVPAHPFAAACEGSINNARGSNTATPQPSEHSFAHTQVTSQLSGYSVLATIIKDAHLACRLAKQWASSGCSQAGEETIAGPPDGILHRHW